MSGLRERHALGGHRWRLTQWHRRSSFARWLGASRCRAWPGGSKNDGSRGDGHGSSPCDGRGDNRLWRYRPKRTPQSWRARAEVSANSSLRIPRFSHCERLAGVCMPSVQALSASPAAGHARPFGSSWRASAECPAPSVATPAVPACARLRIAPPCSRPQLHSFISPIIARNRSAGSGR